MSAKDAALQKTGSHWVSDDNYSSRADGISKEEVYFYFTAQWRGRPVQVEVSADRYAHSSGISEWRVYARDARFYDPERNGGRGEATTGTARAALGKLCVPIAEEWLTSDAYTASFQNALAHMVMRKFDGRYSATRDVQAALVTFKDRLPKPTLQAISDALEAWQAFEAAKAQAFDAIKVAAELDQLAEAVSA
jgi:hypothetical protein